MSQDVIFQGRLFAMAVIWGAGLMLAYDGLRLLRLFVTHRKGVQVLEEGFFWVFASCILYALIYRYNSGAVRNYVVFGLTVGMLVYRCFISAHFMRAACLVLRPLRNCMRRIKTFVKDAGKRLKSAAAGVKIKLKDAKRRQSGKQGD